MGMLDYADNLGLVAVDVVLKLPSHNAGLVQFCL